MKGEIRIMRYIVAAMALLVLAGCAAKQQKDLSAFKQAAPRSVLIVPVVNKSLDVDAPNYFLSTVSRPLVARGYYVFPVNAVKEVMEQEGMGDADMVHAADTTRLAGLFGADVVLYVTVNRWDAKYALLTTTVTVDLAYTIKDGKTGQLLWDDKRVLVYQPQNSNSTGNPIADLIGMAVQAAITKAAPNYIPLAQQANAASMATLPEGPYFLRPTSKTAGGAGAVSSQGIP